MNYLELLVMKGGRPDKRMYNTTPAANTSVALQLLPVKITSGAM